MSNYSQDHSLIAELWAEIEKKYSGKKRHYHNLQHLENLLVQLQAVKTEIADWNTVLFTLYYHDSIYSAVKSDNEERSAVLAEKRMLQLQVPKQMITICKNQILATKSHLHSTISDTNYFTDADLSVLGQNWDVYALYCENVRKEYAIYPDFIYNPGRKKVLQHFLSMSRIFKTDFFYQNYERQARSNLQRELMSY